MMSKEPVSIEELETLLADAKAVKQRGMEAYPQDPDEGVFDCDSYPKTNRVIWAFEDWIEELKKGKLDMNEHEISVMSEDLWDMYKSGKEIFVNSKKRHGVWRKRDIQRFTRLRSFVRKMERYYEQENG